MLNNLVQGLITVVLLLTLISGLSDLYKAVWINISKEQTSGQITSVNNSWGLRICHPCDTYSFKFKTLSGEEIQSEQKFYVRPGYEEGETVQVIYSGVHPKLAILEYGSFGIWLGVIAKIVLGSGFVVFVLPFVKRKTKSD